MPSFLLNYVRTGGKSKQQFQGSYYVLEVGNFDPIGEPPVVSPPTSGDDVTTPTQLQPGYYMLDLQNFEEDERESTKVAAEPKYSSVNVRYENVNPAVVGSKVRSRPTSRLSPENHIAESATSRSQPTSSNIDNSQKTTVYENVIISALGVPEPVVPFEHPYNVPPPKGSFSMSEAEPPRPSRADGRGSMVVPIEDEGGYTLVNETGKMLGVGGVIVSSRPPDCYLERKYNDVGQSDSQGHVTSGQAYETSPSKRKRREELYESVKMGGGANSGSNKPRPPSVATPLVNGTAAAESDRRRPLLDASTANGEMTASIVDNPRDNPFAGLVLSASRQLEESLPRPTSQLSTTTTTGGSPSLPVLGGDSETAVDSGRFRGRVETIWDDIRMQKEWTKVSRRFFIHTV